MAATSTVGEPLATTIGTAAAASEKIGSSCKKKNKMLSSAASYSPCRASSASSSQLHSELELLLNQHITKIRKAKHPETLHTSASDTSKLGSKLFQAVKKLFAAHCEVLERSGWQRVTVQNLGSEFLKPAFSTDGENDLAVPAFPVMLQKVDDDQDVCYSDGGVFFALHCALLCVAAWCNDTGAEVPPEVNFSCNLQQQLNHHPRPPFATLATSSASPQQRHRQSAPDALFRGEDEDEDALISHLKNVHAKNSASKTETEDSTNIKKSFETKVSSLNFRTELPPAKVRHQFSPMLLGMFAAAPSQQEDGPRPARPPSAGASAEAPGFQHFLTQLSSQLFQMLLEPELRPSHIAYIGPAVYMNEGSTRLMANHYATEKDSLCAMVRDLLLLRMEKKKEEGAALASSDKKKDTARGNHPSEGDPLAVLSWIVPSWILLPAPLDQQKNDMRRMVRRSRAPPPRDWKGDPLYSTDEEDGRDSVIDGQLWKNTSLLSLLVKHHCYGLLEELAGVAGVVENPPPLSGSPSSPSAATASSTFSSSPSPGRLQRKAVSFSGSFSSNFLSRSPAMQEQQHSPSAKGQQEGEEETEEAEEAGGAVPTTEGTGAEKSQTPPPRAHHPAAALLPWDRILTSHSKRPLLLTRKAKHSPDTSSTSAPTIAATSANCQLLEFGNILHLVALFPPTSEKRCASLQSWLKVLAQRCSHATRRMLCHQQAPRASFSPAPAGCVERGTTIASATKNISFFNSKFTAGMAIHVGGARKPLSCPWRPNEFTSAPPQPKQVEVDMHRATPLAIAVAVNAIHGHRSFDISNKCYLQTTMECLVNFGATKSYCEKQGAEEDFMISTVAALNGKEFTHLLQGCLTTVTVTTPKLLKASIVPPKTETFSNPMMLAVSESLNALLSAASGISIPRLTAPSFNASTLSSSSSSSATVHSAHGPFAVKAPLSFCRMVLEGQAPLFAPNGLVELLDHMHEWPSGAMMECLLLTPVSKASLLLPVESSDSEQKTTKSCVHRREGNRQQRSPGSGNSTREEGKNIRRCLVSFQKMEKCPQCHQREPSAARKPSPKKTQISMFEVEADDDEHNSYNTTDANELGGEERDLVEVIVDTDPRTLLLRGTGHSASGQRICYEREMDANYVAAARMAVTLLDPNRYSIRGRVAARGNETSLSRSTESPAATTSTASHDVTFYDHLAGRESQTHPLLQRLNSAAKNAANFDTHDAYWKNIARLQSGSSRGSDRQHAGSTTMIADAFDTDDVYSSQGNNNFLLQLSAGKSHHSNNNNQNFGFQRIFLTPTVCDHCHKPNLLEQHPRIAESLATKVVYRDDTSEVVETVKTEMGGIGDTKKKKEGRRKKMVWRKSSRSIVEVPDEEELRLEDEGQRRRMDKRRVLNATYITEKVQLASAAGHIFYVGHLRTILMLGFRQCFDNPRQIFNYDVVNLIASFLPLHPAIACSSASEADGFAVHPSSTQGPRERKEEQHSPRMPKKKYMYFPSTSREGQYLQWVGQYIWDLLGSRCAEQKPIGVVPCEELFAGGGGYFNILVPEYPQ